LLIYIKGGVSLEPSLTDLLSNTKVLATIAVQFLLGLGLGYISVKALKYVLAFIAILVLGSFLSVWSLGGSVEETLSVFGELAGTMKNLLLLLGIMTVGPVSVGFIVGVLLGILRK
jgi:uncharacterized membrane protein (Fun14 family)